MRTRRWPSGIAVGALQLQYQHVGGAWIGLSGAAVDTGGHFTHQAYAFVAKYQALHPEFPALRHKGSSEDGSRSRRASAKWMDINLQGRRQARRQAVDGRHRHGEGPVLWPIQGDAARPGLRALREGSAARVVRAVRQREAPAVHRARAAGVRWVHMRGRNEAIDTTVLALFVFEALNVAKFDERHWQQLEQQGGRAGSVRCRARECGRCRRADSAGGPIEAHRSSRRPQSDETKEPAKKPAVQ
jgi:phage terminase large subunit GpA-like protein